MRSAKAATPPDRSAICAGVPAIDSKPSAPWNPCSAASWVAIAGETVAGASSVTLLASAIADAALGDNKALGVPLMVRTWSPRLKPDRPTSVAASVGDRAASADSVGARRVNRLPDGALAIADASDRIPLAVSRSWFDPLRPVSDRLGSVARAAACCAVRMKSDALPPSRATMPRVAASPATVDDKPARWAGVSAIVSVADPTVKWCNAARATACATVTVADADSLTVSAKASAAVLAESSS